MRARKLAVDGAVEFVPDVFPDDRGLFVSPFQEAAFVEAVGRPLFPVAQTSASVSRLGVVRGIHFTRTPPGASKYVHCSRGRVLDYVIDLRLGSPTFGAWDVVELNGSTFNGVYFPTGLGHAFAALEEDSMVCYLLSRGYVPADELAIHPLDPDIGLTLPVGEPRLSERDTTAPTLMRAKELGLLPDYDLCRSLDGVR